jgi:hypothetical protein
MHFNYERRGINVFMRQAFVFQPESLPGIIFHIGALLALAGGAGWGIWQVGRAEIGPLFLAAIAPVALAVGLGPLLVYRGLALRSAAYTLERDGIRLRWGLRSEAIPVNAIRWLRRSSEMQEAFPLPWPRWPGSVVGVRKLPGGGQIEFMASRSADLVLIAAGETVYAISPYSTDEFLETYQRLSELGSLAPLPAHSTHPSFLVARFWQAPLARLLVLAGAILNLVMLVWIILVAPGREQVVLGFIPGSEAAPAVRLLLLPILSGFFFLVDFFLGLFFFRRRARVVEEEQPSPNPGQVLAYLLWGSGALSALLFLLGTFFILQMG